MRDERAQGLLIEAQGGKKNGWPSSVLHTMGPLDLDESRPFIPCHHAVTVMRL